MIKSLIQQKYTAEISVEGSPSSIPQAMLDSGDDPNYRRRPVLLLPDTLLHRLAIWNSQGQSHEYFIKYSQTTINVRTSNYNEWSKL